MIRWILLISFSVFLMFSCKSDVKPNKASEKENTSKTIKKKNKSDKNSYWATAKKKVGLTNQEVKKIKAINKKYEKLKSALVKNKKWTGKANEKTRANHNDKRTAELKNLLGKKYDKWVKFAKDYRKKKRSK